jgi:uncharacterized membrane protein
MARNLNREYEEQLSFGDRIADKLTEFGGSWTFIGLFFLSLIVWIGINTYTLSMLKHFDEYPYILLNLILSCLAAIQAPIIMMSQHRQAAKDRLSAEHDYEVNVKAELEIEDIQQDLAMLQQDSSAIKSMLKELLTYQQKNPTR